MTQGEKNQRDDVVSRLVRAPKGDEGRKQQARNADGRWSARQQHMQFTTIQVNGAAPTNPVEAGQLGQKGVLRVGCVSARGMHTKRNAKKQHAAGGGEREKDRQREGERERERVRVSV